MGSRALVTGAAGGIGAAVAAELAGLGHEVLLGGRDGTALAATAQRIGGRALPLDVDDDGSVAAALAAAGPVDVLVNCAGALLTAGQPPAGVDLGLAEREIRTNALGAWRVAQAVLPAMSDRGRGRVVNVSSGTASFRHGLFAGAPGYTVSKVALNAVTVLLAEQLRGTGVLVNAINPGRVRTRMMPRADRTPEQAAPLVVWAATLPDDGPTGGFFSAPGAELDW